MAMMVTMVMMVMMVMAVTVMADMMVKSLDGVCSLGHAKGSGLQRSQRVGVLTVDCNAPRQASSHGM